MLGALPSGALLGDTAAGSEETQHRPTLLVVGGRGIATAEGRGLPRHALALLVLGGRGVLGRVTVVARPDWDGGSWWGPRYLVQVTPLLLIPAGALISAPRVRRIYLLSVFHPTLFVETNDDLILNCYF